MRPWAPGPLVVLAFVAALALARTQMPTAQAVTAGNSCPSDRGTQIYTSIKPSQLKRAVSFYET